ncbi:MAG TPA: peptidoglycan DD-metalloendopeptidase family protein [Aggregatilineales bacterium]|nr:peptidoglycan DD-metalloendopeptidase family protein [Aggregatilineales bacterium]
MAGTVFIRGIPQLPDVAARNAPGLQGTTVLFRPTKETTATCSDTAIDPNGDNLNGQVYKWFFLTFGEGRSGWVRDDLLDLQGDCSAFGYGNYPNRVWAFTGLSEGTPPPSPVTPPVVQPTSPVSAAGSGSCTASVRREIRAKLRATPSLTGTQIGLIDPGTAVSISGAVAGQDDPSYQWIHATVSGKNGYIREDLLDYSGDCTSLGLRHAAPTPPAPPAPVPSGPIALFPAPLTAHYTVFQEFGGMLFGQPHKGIDLDIPVGTPLIASGPGVVAYLRKCTKCTAAQPNFQSQGLPSWDSNAINDPAWGYGFGNAVVVRYAYNVLPDTMRAAMDNQNLRNGSAYVIHGHMSRVDVAAGTPVQAGTPLGLSGNTGNSTGPHLHLEVRMSLKSNEIDMAGRPVINPRTMYSL